MKRTTAILLCAIMVLGMIPSSLLSVIAADNGVIYTDHLNQSINNSATQSIPESVTIDGNVDSDTAWANNKWNEVDKNNGTWNTDSPSEESKKLTYKYQLHYDYEYFYGAIVLGDGIKTADITVWLKDGSNTAGGYSHKINYTVSNGVVSDNGMVDYNGTAVGDASLPAQKYLVAYGNGDNVTIEFRRYLDSFTSVDASNIEYFVSVTYADNTLYFPRIKVEGELLTFSPTFEYWPSAELDNHLDFQEHKDELSPITVDGNFDEAAWAGLTDFYLQAEDPNIVDEKVNGNKGTVGFDTVKTHGYQSNEADNDRYIATGKKWASNDEAKANLANDVITAESSISPTPNLGVNNAKDASQDGGSDGVRFKYDYRIDGEYFYIAVVAEVPNLIYSNTVTVGADTMTETNAKNQYYPVHAYPNITIQFYNKTGKYFDTSGNPMSTNLYNGWAVEHLITYESYKMIEENPNYSGAFSNITSRVTSTNGKIQNVNWWTDFAEDDTYRQDMSNDATGYQGAGSYQGVYGDYGVYYFESRVKLEAIMSSDAIEKNKTSEDFDIGDLGFNVVVHDRRWLYDTDYGQITIGDKDYKLQYAYLANGQWFYTNHYNRNAAWCGSDSDQYAEANIQKISTAECTGNDTTGIVIDGNLDKRNNAALAGADYFIDSTYRDANAYPDANMQYTYILTADHEYLYGAAVITNGSKGTQFRLWTNCNDSALYENVLDFSIEDFSTGTVKLVSWYSGGSNIISSKANCDVKVVGVKVNDTDVRLEFRIALSEIGCVPTLSPAKNQKLLSYYVSVEKYGNSQNRGLIHPRCLTFGVNGWDSLHEGRIFYNDSFDKDTLKTDGVRAFDHNDSLMLQYVAIDGKLEEEIWNDESDRTVVNGDTGRWTLSPTKNDVFEYSYSIYSGDNYIYGAVELDVEAIAKQNKDDTDFTCIEIWFSNPAAYDNWGIYDGTEDEKHIYDNYLFDMYFISDEVKSGLTFDVPTFPTENGTAYVYGGSTPQTNEEYYKWGMTTANGKTYAEFMISTECKDDQGNRIYDRFNVDEEHGVDYFVKVIHPTETEETLELTYPPVDDMFYLTHLNVNDREGLGVIFTDYSLYSSIEQYRWWTHVLFKPAANGNWEVVDVRSTANRGVGDPKPFSLEEFNAAGGFIYCLNYGNNYIDVWNGVQEGFAPWLATKGYDAEYGTVTADKVGEKDATWQAQRAAYMEEYISTVYLQSAKSYRNYEENAEKLLNFYSLEAVKMDDQIANSWKQGTIINIPYLSSSGGDVDDQVQAMLDMQTAEQTVMRLQRYVDNEQRVYSQEFCTENNITIYADGFSDTVSTAYVQYTDEVGFINPTITNPHITSAPVIVEAIPYYYESGYKHIFTFDVVSQNTDWDNNLPTESVWNGDNYGKLDALEFDYPEKITVDGELNDSGWDAEQWITVNHGINATLQSNRSNEFQLKYQLRVDGEYIYVAAVFEGVEYTAANNPNFWLWINDDTANSETFTKYYKVGYKWNGMEENALWDCTAYKAMVPDLPDYHSYPSGGLEYSENFTLSGEGGNKGYVIYDNLINVIKNTSGGKPDGASSEGTEYLQYPDSSIFGYTDVVEESIGGRYYPDINIERSKITFGNECAVMKGDGSVAINGIGSLGGASTVVEFRIDLDEIDAERDGFEYFVSASRLGSDGSDFTMFYPNVYCEPDSDYSYHNHNMPFWKWYSDTSAKITADDYAGDMYMSNEYAPVVTLGAKFNRNISYTNDKGETIDGVNAIRFGGVYHESMIRRQSGDDTTTYWDVTEMGIVVVPTAFLGNESKGNDLDLDLETVGAKKAQAVGIVDWKNDAELGNSNFADYESFAFYVTVPNVPSESIKLSARTYICYRDLTTIDGKTHGTNADDYYGQTIVRSIELIEKYQDVKNGETDNLPK